MSPESNSDIQFNSIHFDLIQVYSFSAKLQQQLPGDTLYYKFKC